MDWESFLSGSSGLLGLLGGGALLNSAYDRLGAIGEAAQQGAQAISQAGLEQTEFKPFGITSSTGGTFGYDPATGTSTYALSPQEQAIQGMMMGQAQTALGSTPYGQAAGRTASEQAYGLGGKFMENLGMSTADRESDVYSRIRAVQRPEEQRNQMALEERLFNQGRMGVSTNLYGGTPEQLAMSKAQEEAKNQAALSAIQQAQAEQAQMGNLANTYTMLGSNLASQDLAARAGQQQLGLGALAGAYVPQAQMNNLIQANQLFPQLQQKGQLSGAGLFGEASMGGLEALLGAGLGQANLMGQLGSGLLTGLSTPTGSYGGLADILGGVPDVLKGLFGNDMIPFTGD